MLTSQATVGLAEAVAVEVTVATTVLVPVGVLLGAMLGVRVVVAVDVGLPAEQMGVAEVSFVVVSPSSNSIDIVTRYHEYCGGIPTSLNQPSIVFGPAWTVTWKFSVSNTFHGPPLAWATSKCKVAFPLIVHVPLNWKL